MTNLGSLLLVSIGLFLALSRSSSSQECGSISNRLLQEWNAAEVNVNKVDNEDTLEGRISYLGKEFMTKGFQCGWIIVHQVDRKFLEHKAKKSKHSGDYQNSGTLSTSQVQGLDPEKGGQEHCRPIPAKDQTRPHWPKSELGPKPGAYQKYGVLSHAGVGQQPGLLGPNITVDPQ